MLCVSVDWSHSVCFVCSTVKAVVPPCFHCSDADSAFRNCQAAKLKWAWSVSAQVGLVFRSHSSLCETKVLAETSTLQLTSVLGGGAVYNITQFVTAHQSG